MGAAVGSVVVVALCDAGPCWSHPDTRRILLRGAGVGAGVGLFVDFAALTAALRRPRR